jgi:tetratricopeptide (TPR) repeat protein
MKIQLLESLLSFYEEDPSDPFNIYALALEYLKTDLGQAEAYFNQLLEKHPGYLPTYYHAAEHFALSGDIAKATEVYEKGIALAKEQNHQKTYQELTRAYRSFLDELDE